MTKVQQRKKLRELRTRSKLYEQIKDELDKHFFLKYFLNDSEILFNNFQRLFNDFEMFF